MDFKPICAFLLYNCWKIINIIHFIPNNWKTFHIMQSSLTIQPVQNFSLLCYVDDILNGYSKMETAILHFEGSCWTNLL